MKRYTLLLAALTIVATAGAGAWAGAAGAGRDPGGRRGGGLPDGGLRGGGGRAGAGRGPVIPAGIKVESNVPYVVNGQRSEVVDIYYPEQAPEKALPLMIWIHGGAWLGGSQANPPCLFLLGQGYAVASIQHRMSGEAKWPAQAYDCKAAVRFLRANAARYHVDPEHFGIGGDSSGGHLAAFVGTSGDVKEMEGDLGNPGVSSRVQAVVDWFGPTDLLMMDAENGGRGLQHNSANSPESMLLGGPLQQMKDVAKTANPITYVDSKDPPFLIMHGDNDQLVPHGQSVELAKALLDAGVEVTMKTLPGAGHEDPRFRSPENQRLMREFLDLHLKAGLEP